MNYRNKNTMSEPRKNILLLCAEVARQTGTVDLHINSFSKYSKFNVVTLDSFVAGQLDLDLDMFDAVVLHYSIVISLPHFISEEFGSRIARFSGPKILFIQDEFRWVDRSSEAIRKLGVSVLFTVVNEDVIRKIYRDDYFDNVRFEQTLTGFVPEHLLGREVPDYEARELDIGYRARKLPGWCGSFALQKWQIGQRVLESAPAFNLKCDIAMSEASRIYGEDWIRFMSNCKATLGTESGASFVDYSGLVHQEVDRFEARNPEAGFEEVRDRFLEGRDGEVVIHVVSPRVFEAAALRTLMILYPGTYSGVLTAGRHYVELKPDHSNFPDVVKILRDPDRAGEIIDNAYREVACAPTWTHAAFIEHFDAVLGEELALQRHRKPEAPVGNIQQYVRGRFEFLEQEDARCTQQEGRTREEERCAQEEKEGEEERKLAAMKALEEASRKAVIKTQRRMKYVMFLQKIRVALYNFIDRMLPRVISVRLLKVGRFLSGILKPLIKKILFRN